MTPPLETLRKLSLASYEIEPVTSRLEIYIPTYCAAVFTKKKKIVNEKNKSKQIKTVQKLYVYWNKIWNL